PGPGAGGQGGDPGAGGPRQRALGGLRGDPLQGRGDAAGAAAVRAARLRGGAGAGHGAHRAGVEDQERVGPLRHQHGPGDADRGPLGEGDGGGGAAPVDRAAAQRQGGGGAEPAAVLGRHRGGGGGGAGDHHHHLLHQDVGPAGRVLRRAAGDGAG